MVSKSNAFAEQSGQFDECDHAVVGYDASQSSSHSREYENDRKVGCRKSFSPCYTAEKASKNVENEKQCAMTH